MLSQKLRTANRGGCNGDHCHDRTNFISYRFPETLCQLFQQDALPSALHIHIGSCGINPRCLLFAAWCRRLSSRSVAACVATPSVMRTASVTQLGGV